MELIILSEQFGVFMETESGFEKLEGFSELGFESGAQSYVRKYFSAREKAVDIAESLPVIKYKFDRLKNNAVHQEIVKITDDRLVGEDAVKCFVFVDFSDESEGMYSATKQCFAVKGIKRDSGQGYFEYSGNLIAKKDVEKGCFVLNKDLKSGEFVSERRGILCD